MPDNKYTPNRINYNFDVTSPYYINITHRKKCRTPEPVVTKSPSVARTPEELVSNSDSSYSDTEVVQKNLFTLNEQNLQEFNGRKSSGGRKTLVDNWRENVAQHRQSFSHHTMNDVRRILDSFCEDGEQSFCNQISSTRNSDNMFTFDTTFQTAISEQPNVLYHMAEVYEHTDAENGVEFVERKVCAQPMPA